ncbi:MULTISPECIES: hypothetical protein [Weeksellaceae]|uniref:hypothetical protein n=1 Tax=Weeksellaceae TaxID=2762318 RepID=UPI0021F84F8E|nr:MULTISPECIES: hypothetical protein [Weeksellaceae]MCW0488312.1 hypothetical protein [Riemerella anatipestifer]MEC5395236.1 hypothetical protein [Bergeyella sp. RCAD1439]MEE3725574.1 hypothetical protein [Riemerella anatipestifer]
MRRKKKPKFLRFEIPDEFYLNSLGRIENAKNTLEKAKKSKKEVVFLKQGASYQWLKLKKIINENKSKY